MSFPQVLPSDHFGLLLRLAPALPIAAPVLHNLNVAAPPFIPAAPHSTRLSSPAPANAQPAGPGLGPDGSRQRQVLQDVWDLPRHTDASLKRVGNGGGIAMAMHGKEGFQLGYGQRSSLKRQIAEVVDGDLSE